MSRIYEALQRADRERQAAPASDGHHAAAPILLPGIDESPSVEAGFSFEQIAQRTWKPSLLSFPALADRSEGVEQFRGLRSRIYQARYAAPLKTILISSGMPSEGKSFVAANLAVSLARNGINNILLIDGDLRRPTLHTLLGAPNVLGLSDYLAGTAEWNAVMQRERGANSDLAAAAGSLSNLTFIAAGKCGDNSSELVANHRIEELIRNVSPHFDWIVIDSPPVLAVSDAVELSHCADAVLLIARGASTPYEVAQRTCAAFGDARVLGFVLNDVKDAPRRGSYYGYYYGAPHPNGQSKERKGGGKPE